jgi:transcription antitermination factor NusG
VFAAAVSVNVGAFCPLISLWKNAHPSEDSEALYKSNHQSVGQGAEPELVDARRVAGWFAVYTTARHEKVVARHFQQREIEYYLPLYRSDRRWSDGSRVTLELPLFPCYIFVHIPRCERVRVLEVPGVLTIVAGTAGEPAALPDAAIEAMRSGFAERRAEPHPLLTVGQRARIRSGALAGMEGVVVRSKGCLRVVLTIEHIQRSISVEVAAEDLEPLQDEAGERAWAEMAV